MELGFLNHGNDILFGGLASDLVSGPKDEARVSPEGLEDLPDLAAHALRISPDEGFDGMHVSIHGCSPVQKRGHFFQIRGILHIPARRPLKRTDAINADFRKICNRIRIFRENGCEAICRGGGSRPQPPG